MADEDYVDAAKLAMALSAEEAVSKAKTSILEKLQQSITAPPGTFTVGMLYEAFRSLALNGYVGRPAVPQPSVTRVGYDPERIRGGGGSDSRRLRTLSPPLRPGSCPSAPEPGVKGVEHLRAQWRKTASGKQTLYRGISLQGASSRYAWGLDQALVRKFSSAMKKGDHQAAAKLVLDLCEQSGEFVEGGHFGVWWSTDLKVARGYAGMHTRETLGCVIHAEVDAEDINQGHAEQYGYTHESPVVLREGARIDVVAIEVRYNPDLKVLRDGDFVKIPVRRQVTAGVIPATTSTSGPFRTVVDVEVDERGLARERLECGHTGKSGWKAEWLGTTVDGKPTKRRCYDCLTREHKLWLNGNSQARDHECSDACIMPVSKTAGYEKYPEWVELLKPWVKRLSERFGVPTPFLSIGDWGHRDLAGQYMDGVISIYRPNDFGPEEVWETLAHEFAHYLDPRHQSEGGLEENLHHDDVWLKLYNKVYLFLIREGAITIPARSPSSKTAIESA